MNDDEYSVRFATQHEQNDTSHVIVNLFTAANPAVIFPTVTVASEVEWKNNHAGFHTALKASSVNELSFTMVGELANSVHVTMLCAATMAQSLTASD